MACLSSDGLQAVIVAQDEVVGQRSGTDEHFRPGQGVRQAYHPPASLELQHKDPVAIQQSLGQADVKTTWGYIGTVDAEQCKPPAVFSFDLRKLNGTRAQ